MPALGTTNNPAGRTRGTGVVARLRKQMLDDGQVGPLVAKVYALAIAGDINAAKLLLDRIVPALRTQVAAVQFDLPDGSLTVKAEAVLAALAAGDLPPDVASEILSAIGKLVAVETADEMRRRLDALEFGDFA